jgi:hypothetical protein
MTINQLFCKTPDNIILEKIFEAFNLENIHDTRVFTRKDLIKNKTVEKLNLIPELQNYYLPCKDKKYLSDLNEKKAITVLRQFVKTYDYFIFSKEKYIDGEKYITYQLVPVDQKKILKLRKKDEKYVVSFD